MTRAAYDALRAAGHDPATAAALAGNAASEAATQRESMEDLRLTPDGLDAFHKSVASYGLFAEHFLMSLDAYVDLRWEVACPHKPRTKRRLRRFRGRLLDELRRDAE